MARIAAAALIGSVAAQVSDNDWAAWKLQHGRTYNSNDEDAYRRTVFDENMIVAAEHQKANPLARFGPNVLSDLTAAEFKGLLGSKRMNLTGVEKAEIPNVVVGDSQDWTGVATTPIKNQGQCGSCWAFSATEQMESDLMLQGGQTIVLGPQELVDCTSSGSGSYRGGCQGGFPSAAYQVVEALGGMERESSYPYTAQNGYCSFQRSEAAVTVSSYQAVGQGDEDQMRQYVGSSGPLSVCVDASSWQSYQGGILSYCGNQVDHCVQAVGYGSGFWKIRNSWGASWGEQGNIRLSYGQNMCDLTSSPTKTSPRVVGAKISV